jgi:hypothetical protein
MALSEANQKTAERWGSIMAEMAAAQDPAARDESETKGKLIADAVRKTLEGASDDVLFTFISTVASIAAVVLKTPLQDAVDVIEGYFGAYGMAAAVVGGTYTPPGDEPDTEVPGLYL